MQDKAPGTARPLKLDDRQVESFDTEYVTAGRWKILESRIREAYPDGEFRFLDVGGGNGMFTDRVLETFPGSRATLLDNSELLLARNAPHSRKELLCASASDLEVQFPRGSFEIVFYNWVLHHLVTGTYGGSRAVIQESLRSASMLLTPGGHISVFENLPDGRWIDSLPSRLIFGVTSTRALASLAARAGANTAGVGVCYLSRRQWCALMEDAGLEVEGIVEEARVASLPWTLTWGLHLRRGIPRAHFWCRRRTGGS